MPLPSSVLTLERNNLALIEFSRDKSIGAVQSLGPERGGTGWSRHMILQVTALLWLPSPWALRTVLLLRGQIAFRTRIEKRLGNINNTWQGSRCQAKSGNQPDILYGERSASRESTSISMNASTGRHLWNACQDTNLCKHEAKQRNPLCQLITWNSLRLESKCSVSFSFFLWHSLCIVLPSGPQIRGGFGSGIIKLLWLLFHEICSIFYWKEIASLLLLLLLFYFIWTWHI